ncbi:MAG: alkaline phosphatase family protein, partial [Nitrososphaeria archaeon]|nr:alkaline phosphatase family protein [Nitrososphaeria archaeon]
EKDPWITKVFEEGIDVRIFTRYSTIDSGLSKIIYRGQKVDTYALATDLIINLKKALESSSQSLMIAYYPGCDTISHLYGPFSEEAETEFMFFENLIRTYLCERLDSKVRAETLFILTSDHGQAYTENIFFIKDMPKIFEQLIIPPAGDSRATFLFTKQGKVDGVKSLLQNELKGFKVLNSQELLDKVHLKILKKRLGLKKG